MRGTGLSDGGRSPAEHGGGMRQTEEMTRERNRKSLIPGRAATTKKGGSVTTGFDLGAFADALEEGICL